MYSISTKRVAAKSVQCCVVLLASKKIRTVLLKLDMSLIQQCWLLMPPSFSYLFSYKQSH